MSQLTNSTHNQIILVLEERGGEVQGTEALALALGALNCKSYIIRSARRLQSDGEITICKSCGGRGRKTTYKRNRNQPGNPRRVPR
ncbi:MAG: hypothetical protein HY865_00925 [Chloroflexi bacterium]|nr:hypothetical protein [Chloroflexota bacterium]